MITTPFDELPPDAPAAPDPSAPHLLPAAVTAALIALLALAMLAGGWLGVSLAG